MTSARRQDASEDVKWNENDCMTRKTTPRDVTRRPKTRKDAKTRRNTRRKTRREEMISLKRVPATTADPPGGSMHAALFSHRFSDLVFYRLVLGFGSHLGSILQHFSCFLHTFFEHRIRIDFLSIFYRFLVPLIM